MFKELGPQSHTVVETEEGPLVCRRPGTRFPFSPGPVCAHALAGAVCAGSGHARRRRRPAGMLCSSGLGAQNFFKVRFKNEKYIKFI